MPEAANAMSGSDITFAPPSACPETTSGSNNSGEGLTSTTALPAAPAAQSQQGAVGDSDDGLLTVTVVGRKSRSQSSASRSNAQSRRDAPSRSARSASSGSRRSACTPRGATGVSENDLPNPPVPVWTPRGPTEQVAVSDPVWTPRGPTDATNVSASMGIGDADAMLNELIRKHTSEAGRSEPERSQGDASDRSVRSRTSSMVRKRFVPLENVFGDTVADAVGQAKPKSPRAVGPGLNPSGFDGPIPREVQHFQVATPPSEKEADTPPLPPPNSSPPIFGSLLNVDFAPVAGSPLVFGPTAPNLSANSSRVVPDGPGMSAPASSANGPHVVPEETGTSTPGSSSNNPRVVPGETGKRTDAERLAREKDKRHRAEKKARAEEESAKQARRRLEEKQREEADAAAYQF